MTDEDVKFMRELGIVPCILDQFASPLPPTLPTEAPIPKLTEKDARWLINLGVMWEHEVEPEFAPPTTLPEYIDRFPNGVKEATRAVADELGLALPGSGLDHLAREVTRMFVDFAALDLEDVIAMYEFHRSLRPEWRSFPDYMKFRVKACVQTVLQNRIADTDNSGESR